MITFFTACRDRPSASPSRSGVKSGVERLGADRGGVARPSPRRRAAAACRAAARRDRPARGRRRARARSTAYRALVAGERPVVHHQRAGHARLHHQAPVAEIEHGVLGAAEDVAHGRAVEPAHAGGGGSRRAGRRRDSARHGRGGGRAGRGGCRERWFRLRGARALRPECKQRRVARWLRPGGRPPATRCRADRSCPRTRSPRPPRGSGAAPRRTWRRPPVTVSTRPPFTRRTPSSPRVVPAWKTVTPSGRSSGIVIAAPFAGASGYPREASTVVTEAAPAQQLERRGRLARGDGPERAR